MRTLCQRGACCSAWEWTDPGLGDKAWPPPAKSCRGQVLAVNPDSVAPAHACEEHRQLIADELRRLGHEVAA